MRLLANAPQVIAAPFVVTEPSRLWVLLDVTEMDMAAVRAGQPLRVRSRALPGRVFPGKLEVVGSSLDPVTRTVRVRGSVDNADLRLKAEMYVGIDLDVEPEGGAAAPPSGSTSRSMPTYISALSRRSALSTEPRTRTVRVTGSSELPTTSSLPGKTRPGSARLRTRSGWPARTAAMSISVTSSSTHSRLGSVTTKGAAITCGAFASSRMRPKVPCVPVGAWSGPTARWATRSVNYCWTGGRNWA